MLDHNQKIYAARGIVQHYSQLNLLQPAEQTILDLFQAQLPTMSMLDIGVGGGRTTQPFSAAAREYIGIDYSENMIAACRKRFAVAPQTATFQVCDARDMSQFKDNSFDFVLFSFNGIDYASHADRLRILQEVSRVGKPGGYFCFSSHNLHGMSQELDWRHQIRSNPVQTYANLVMLGLLRWHNRSIDLNCLKTASHAILKDESHNFRLHTYYVTPQAQISQLNSEFSDIKVYSWKSGLEITCENELGAQSDLWLYYLCRIKANPILESPRSR